MTHRPIHRCVATRLAVLGGALIWLGCGVSEPESPSVPVPETVSAPWQGMLSHLDLLAGQFEDQRDVKCWTSFKRLETFVAGCQLAPATTHLKTEAVIDLVDQVWRAAAQLQGDARQIDEATFARATERHFRWECGGLLYCSLYVGDRELSIPFQDFENYRGTVEPIRLVQTLARRLQRREPARLPLDESAVDAATRLAAVLSTALLKEANRAAADANHVSIENEDILLASRQLAEAAELVALDPARAESAPVDGAHESERSAMLADIRAKVRSLDVFNTTYSRDVLQQSFTSDLSKQEAQWAQLPVRDDASQAYKEEILVSVADEFYRACAAEHPQTDPLTGLQMLSTITRRVPFATHFEGGVRLFPGSDDVEALVEELEADAFRDTAWHWRCLEQAVVASNEDQGSTPLPNMDLYAMEELSEYVSIYAVALLEVSGRLARERGDDQVSLADVEQAHRLYQRHQREYQSQAAGERPIAPHSAPLRFRDEKAALRQIRSEFIEHIFSDVTSTTGIDFRHETSDLVQDYRFASREELAKQSHGRSLRLYYLDSKEKQFPGRDQYPGEFPSIEIGIAGGGVAVADVDGDDLLDIYLVSGRQDELWKNLGGLTFRNITKTAGLGSADEGRGAYFIDYDNDADQDLFVTHVYAPNRLYQNQGDGTFQDVTAAAGFPLRNDLISHSAVWFDFDNDGWLDVYVGNFGDWLAGELPLAVNNSRHSQPNQLFRNRGDGTFADISERAGAGDTGWAHAVSHFDANNDGWQDLYLANDFGQDVLLINDKGQRFVDGTPDDLFGKFHHGMSVGFTDINRDGVEDVYVSNIAMFSFVTKHIKPDRNVRALASRRTVENARMLENNLFLVSFGDTFLDRHHRYFQRSREGSGWAWDADFFDFNNDGADDLYIVNGREPNLGYNMERNVLYMQFRDQFYDVSSSSGADFRSNSRGCVHADFDNDGDLDLVVNNFQSDVAILRNNLQRNHWIRCRLQGTTSNRDAVGAVVKLYAGEQILMRRVRGGSGFLSKEPCDVHFGLGSNENVDRIEVQWPSGKRQTLTSPAADQLHLIVER